MDVPVSQDDLNNRNASRLVPVAGDIVRYVNFCYTTNFLAITANKNTSQWIKTSPSKKIIITK